MSSKPKYLPNSKRAHLGDLISFKSPKFGINKPQLGFIVKEKTLDEIMNDIIITGNSFSDAHKEGFKNAFCHGYYEIKVVFFPELKLDTKWRNACTNWYQIVKKYNT